MTTDSKQDEARETLCTNCGDKLYQTANPNNLHWYHAASGDVRCPTRFAEPSRASLAAVEGDALAVNIRSQCCNAEVRYRYCAKCGQECRIAAFPSLADAIKVVENCEYENVAVDVILQRLKALTAAASSPLPAPQDDTQTLARLDRQFIAGVKFGQNAEYRQAQDAIRARYEDIHAATCEGESPAKPPQCSGCGNEINPKTCWCGQSIDHGYDNHVVIPMGCDCYHDDAAPAEPRQEGEQDLLWINPEAGVVAHHKAGSAFFLYQRVRATPPNHALVQLLNSALIHPASAEGNIRQVIETLSAAPVVATDDVEGEK